MPATTDLTRPRVCQFAIGEQVGSADILVGVAERIGAPVVDSIQGLVENRGLTDFTFALNTGRAAIGKVGFIAAPNDGDTVTISDGTTSRIYEFDSNGAVTGARIPVPLGSTRLQAMRNLRSAINATPARGLLTFSTTGPTDTQVVTIGDGFVVKTFEFDSNATVTAGNISVDISSGTAAGIATALIAAINAVSNFGVTAYSGGSGVVGLQNDLSGTVGNVAITETGSNLAITTNMTGGLAAPTLVAYDFQSDPDIPILGLRNAVAGTAGNVTLTESTSSARLSVASPYGGMAGGTGAAKNIVVNGSAVASVIVKPHARVVFTIPISLSDVQDFYNFTATPAAGTQAFGNLTLSYFFGDISRRNAYVY